MLPLPFSEATRDWFSGAFGAPTEVQRRGWPLIASGQHSLLLAPTGSGKTLAAFLFALDRLSQLPVSTPPGVRVLYVSPLKALVVDIEKNLRAPLAGLQAEAERQGAPGRAITVGIRTGDTSPKDRVTMQKRPPDVLVTTPESLFLMLLGKSRSILETVEHVIVDEVHSIVGTKRGAHLALTLERLSALCTRDPQRIGLSATVSPVAAVAAFLGGDRPVEVVDTLGPPKISLRITMAPRPVATATPDAPPKTPSIWPLLAARIRTLSEGSRSCIVFVNSRGAAERLSQEVNTAAGQELSLAHHGSLSRERREVVEDALKSGRIGLIVATSSLELGIDMGLVDLVILVESPGAVSRGLQRVGRAGHGVGETSRGVLLPKHPSDLLECIVIADGMKAGRIESTAIPENALDVLAQHLVAACVNEPQALGQVAALVRRAYGYRRLTDALLHSVLDMLTGHFPSTEFADLRPRLVWDRSTDLLTARRGAKLLLVANAGTIPDRGTYPVHLSQPGADRRKRPAGAGVTPYGPRVGELDEEMVYEARVGQTFVLGVSTWRIDEIGRDRVLVSPAPGEPGELPFWRGTGPGRPVELGQAIGAALREQERRLNAAEAILIDESTVDPDAAAALEGYLRAQLAATGRLPTDRTIVVERFRDEIGDLRVCILSPFGMRLHAPWAMALESALAIDMGFKVTALASDDGIAMRFVSLNTASSDSDPGDGWRRFFPDPDELLQLVTTALPDTALFGGVFRECAARALLVPRRGPGRRTPLWSQRQKAQGLLAVARGYANFPIVLETLRTCLQDDFDLPGLTALLRGVASGAIEVHEVATDRASPMARSLVFAYVANFLYADDAPLAERRAQALTLDRALLRDLLGPAALQALLDPEVVAAVEAELQGQSILFQARDPDALHDLLRRLGALTEGELQTRCAGAELKTWLVELTHAGRGFWLGIAGERRYAAAEDVALYRDALGVIPPPEVPAALLAPRPKALDELVLRYGRTHGPFNAERLAARYAVAEAALPPALAALVARGRLVPGSFINAVATELCDPDVLRTIRRRSLAGLRDAVAAATPEAYSRFLLEWQHVDVRQPTSSAARAEGSQLAHVLDQLEGLPLPLSELESRILPARIRGFKPAELDRLAATGELVWVGAGRLGAHDGRVLLLRRERAWLAPLPDNVAPATGDATGVLDILARRGACFLAELRAQLELALTTLVEVLADLAWQGLVTNDSLAPLRAFRAGSRQRQTSHAARLSGGRWSLVSRIAEPPGGTADDPEARRTHLTHQRALQLTGRYGVVAREMAELESLPGGFQLLLPALRGLDDVGTLRRGYFLDGFMGQQYASVAAIDRVRAASSAPPDAAPIALSAVDPALIWGGALPWPSAPLDSETGAKSRTGPRREVGATVVMNAGALWFHLPRSGRELTVFPAAEAVRDASDRVVATLTALARSHALNGRFTIERVGNSLPTQSPLLSALLAAGFERTPRGLAWEK